MRYVQLRAFHNVATFGGFTRAAEALCLTQPAISDQVRKLEEEYDVLLFDRSKRQIVLTDTGRRLLEATRRLFEAERQAGEILSETRALRSGRLRVVADSAHHVVPILGRFRALFPGIEIEITAGNSEEVAASLRDYEADLGVIGEQADAPDFETVHLGASPLVAFVAASHPLAGAGTLTLAEVAEADLVLREPGSKTRRAFMAELEERGLTARIVIEAEGREAVRELVATGAGVGIVSAAEFGYDQRIVKIAIAEAPLMHEALISLRERARSKLIREFLVIARKLVDEVNEANEANGAGVREAG